MPSVRKLFGDAQVCVTCLELVGVVLRAWNWHTFSLDCVWDLRVHFDRAPRLVPFTGSGLAHFPAPFRLGFVWGSQRWQLPTVKTQVEMLMLLLFLRVAGRPSLPVSAPLAGLGSIMGDMAVSFHFSPLAIPQSIVDLDGEIKKSIQVCWGLDVG